MAAPRRTAAAGRARSARSPLRLLDGAAQPRHQRQEIAKVAAQVGGEVRRRASFEVDFDHAEIVPQFDRLDVTDIRGEPFRWSLERVFVRETPVGPGETRLV